MSQTTEIKIDPDVHAVMEFMQTRIAANRLVLVANGVAAIAPLLWQTDQLERVQALQLIAPPIAPADTPAASSE